MRGCLPHTPLQVQSCACAPRRCAQSFVATQPPSPQPVGCTGLCCVAPPMPVCFPCMALKLHRTGAQAPPEPGQAWLNFRFNQQDILRHLPTVA